MPIHISSAGSTVFYFPFLYCALWRATTVKRSAGNEGFKVLVSWFYPSRGLRTRTQMTMGQKYAWGF